MARLVVILLFAICVPYAAHAGSPSKPPTLEQRVATLEVSVSVLQATVAAIQMNAVRFAAVVGTRAAEMWTTSTTYQDIPDTLVRFQTDSPSTCVLAQFSVLSRGDGGNVYIRAVLDTDLMNPGEHMRYAGPIPGPGSYTFFRCGVASGAHQLIIQYASAVEGTIGLVSERTLLVQTVQEPTP